MDTRQLEYVVAVAEELSFTRAARRCHIVQSGLSHQIASLERELGTELFERTSRVVRLLPAGEALLPRARRVLAEIAAARAELAALAGVVSGVLRLGVIPGGHGPLDLPDLLAAFRVRHPDVDLLVSDFGSRALAAAVLAGDLDVAFVGLFPDQMSAELDCQVLSVEPLMAVIDETEPAARRRTVDLAELAATSAFIDCHHDSGLRTQVDAAFARAGVHRHVSFELGDVADLARMASLGLGSAIVPKPVLARLPPAAGRRYVTRRLSDRLALQPVTLVTAAVQRRTPATTAFLDLVASLSSPESA